MQLGALPYTTRIMSKSDFLAYDFDDYRMLLKRRLESLREKRPGLSWRKIAARVPLQATYLSRALNEAGTHLSEDHLFQICQWLDLDAEEIDFALMLRSRAITQQAARIEQLTKKINDLRSQRIIRAEYQAAAEKNVAVQSEYLFDPICVIVHAALGIKKYCQTPTLLCPLIGIAPARLKRLLETLDRNGYIELGSEPFEIKAVHPIQMHFGREHPMMRIHQSLLKSNLIARLGQTPEDKKESFFVTMAMDAEGFAKAKEAFTRFIQEVRAINMSRPKDRLFQLNYDLLEWF